MSNYVIEYDHSTVVDTNTGIGGRRFGVLEISAATHLPGANQPGPVFQTVYKNGALVESIFNYDRSHFSVADSGHVFRGYTLDQNFSLLRKMCALGDAKTEHVSSLIQGFSLTDEHGAQHDVVVGEGKYKSALFLYWLAEGSNQFLMDDEKRQLVWNYFGHDVCTNALEDPGTKHTTVRYLLNQWGSRVRIVRPSRARENVDWEEPATLGGREDDATRL